VEIYRDDYAKVKGIPDTVIKLNYRGKYQVKQNAKLYNSTLFTKSLPYNSASYTNIQMMHQEILFSGLSFQ